MHPDAVRNYSKNADPKRPDSKPYNITDMSDSAVVRTLWDNTRYQQDVGDTHFEHVTFELREAWASFRDADAKPSDPEREEAYGKIRRGFEEHGWHGSPLPEKG